MKLLHRIALGGLLGVSLLFAPGTAQADKDHGRGHAWGQDKDRDNNGRGHAWGHDKDRDDHDRGRSDWGHQQWRRGKTWGNNGRSRSDWGHRQWRRGKRPVYRHQVVKHNRRTYRSRRYYSTIRRQTWR